MHEETGGRGEGEAGQTPLPRAPLMRPKIVADKQDREPSVTSCQAHDRSQWDGENGAPPLDNDQIGRKVSDTLGGPEPGARAEGIEDRLTVSSNPATARVEFGRSWKEQ